MPLCQDWTLLHGINVIRSFQPGHSRTEVPDIVDVNLYTYMREKSTNKEHFIMNTRVLLNQR